jgi:hypothetical protein
VIKPTGNNEGPSGLYVALIIAYAK